MTPSPTLPDTVFRKEWRWLVLLWLAAGVLMAMIMWHERSNMEAIERQRLVHQVRVIHDNLGRQLEAIHRSLSAIAGDVLQLRGQALGTDTLDDRLRTLHGAMSGISSLNVLDEHGTVIASSQDGLRGESLAHRAYFQTARQLAATAPHTLVVGAPARTLLGSWAITLARPVRGVQGRLEGVAIATLDSAAFETLLDSVRYTPDVVSTLVHGDGLRFLAVPDSEQQPGASVAQPGTLFSDHMQGGQPVSLAVGLLEPGQPQRLMALHTIRPDGLHMDKPLVVGVGRDWRLVLAGWYSRALWLGAAWLLAAGASAWWLGRSHRRRRRLWRREQDLAAQQAALQARWRVVLQATQQGVWDWDIAGGAVYFSPVWKSILGYEDADIAATLTERENRIHPDDVALVQADLQRHLRGETPCYDNVHRMRCKDGSYKWVHERGQATERDADGRPLRLIGTHTDVTAQRQHQETLDRLAENVPGVLYQYQREPDGRSHLPYVSRGVQDLYGLSAEQLRANAQSMLECIHPDDLPALQGSVLQSAQTLQLWRAEFRVTLPGRGERWLSGQARPSRTASGAVLWHGYVQDVTAAKQQTLQLQETERLLKHLMQEMPIGLCMTDGAGRIYFRNRRFQELFGYTDAEVGTLQQWRLRAYPDAAYRSQIIASWSAALAQAAKRGGEIAGREVRVTDRDGRMRTMVVGGRVFGDHYMTTFMDLTEQRAQNELLRKLAYRDGLTGLANRRQFDRSLKAEWRRCRRSSKPLALVMIDIDHFKQFNDLHGHQKGDDCLRCVAAALRSALGRPFDLVARYGGEEFVCLLPECDAPGARAIAQSLCHAVQALCIEHRGSQVAQVVTVSAGVASEVPTAQTSPEDLLARADACLYRAKTTGRNRVSDEVVVLL